MNGYELTRIFVDYSFENPSKIKPNHYALYFFSIEHCNRLGWKPEFGLPTTMSMEAIGIKSYNTYKKTFDDLADFGFFEVIERSKNQYSSNIIKLSKNDNALDNALDKAFIKHRAKQGESIDESIDSIIKQINNKQLNNKQINRIKTSINENYGNNLKLDEIPPFEDFLAHALSKKSNLCHESVKAKYESWIENGWKDGNDKEIKIWKSKLTNTVQYLKEKEINRGYNPMESVWQG